MTVTVELRGLEIFGRHGVEEEEQRDGQVFLFDLRLEVSDAAMSDRLEDAVDYRPIAARVREVSDSRRFNLLEGLAAAVADALLADFPLISVRVRVRKRGARPGGHRVQWTAATVSRARA